MASKTIKAIPALYKSVMFRSKTESTFAKWCDTNKQEWQYEPEGLTDGQTSYLPDFYLPASRLIVEIKPAFFTSETHKLDMLFSSKDFDDFGLVVIEMTPLLRVLKYSAPEYDIAGIDEATGEFLHGRVWAGQDASECASDICCAGFCYKCGAFNICGNCFKWVCLACGHYDRDNTISASYNIS